jgi:hypothetical protein
MDSLEFKYNTAEERKQELGTFGLFLKTVFSFLYSYHIARFKYIPTSLHLVVLGRCFAAILKKGM